MGIFELFEIGLFTALWNWTNPILTLIVYSCILAGMIIQWFFRKKYMISSIRWSFVILCLAAVIMCECFWHFITGWQRLTVDIVYGSVICMMLGALILEIGCKMRKVKF